MPLDWTFVWLSAAGALAGGVWLAWLVAPRAPQGRETAVYALWIWAVLPLPLVVLAALRWRAGLALAGAFTGLPLVATFAAASFYADREYGNVARSLGASEWRVFRLVLPMAWRAVLIGAVMAFLRIVVERAIAANL